MVATENKLVANLTPKQQDFYRDFMQASNDIESESEHELIKYMFKIISQIFNYQQK